MTKATVHSTVRQKRKKREKKAMSINHTTTISISFTTPSSGKAKRLFNLVDLTGAQRKGTALRDHRLPPRR
jgi:hypothetical protein